MVTFHARNVRTFEKKNLDDSPAKLVHWVSPREESAVAAVTPAMILDAASLRHAEHDAKTGARGEWIDI